MKTTKAKQEQTRRAILQAAVDLISAQGYQDTTMKQVAREAGIGDATVYKYFPSKEKLLLGFLEQCVQDALAETLATPEFADFTLHEKLQRLLDVLLFFLDEERDFVEICREAISNSPLLLMRDQIPGHGELKQQILDFLREAEEREEIVPCGFKPLLSSLFIDYMMIVVLYWLKDKSEENADTTQLIDLTLEIFVLILQTGIINKCIDLGSFMLRNQLARVLRSGSGVFDLLKLAKRGLGG